MSYCRWSSDNWRSAVYVYESDRGFETHVACNKVLGEIPQEPSLADLDRASTPEQLREWSDQYNAVMGFLETAERAPIGLPHDGESFNDPTPAACADRLEALRALGYHVPQYAIDELRAEESDV